MLAHSHLPWPNVAAVVQLPCDSMRLFELFSRDLVIVYGSTLTRVSRLPGAYVVEVFPPGSCEEFLAIGNVLRPRCRLTFPRISSISRFGTVTNSIQQSPHFPSITKGKVNGRWRFATVLNFFAATVRPSIFLLFAHVNFVGLGWLIAGGGSQEPVEGSCCVSCGRSQWRSAAIALPPTSKKQLGAGATGAQKQR